MTLNSTSLSRPDKAVKPKLYALVVGIGAYERVNQLRGPVGDAQALVSYLQQLADFDLHLRVLTDQQANKSAIISGFQTHLARAEPADTMLFYFAGHGAQETADTSIWPTETDGKLECIVCHDKGAINTWDFLLADKEQRYLINQVSATGAHLVTVFDCCHSGDNTRAVNLLTEALAGHDVRERRLSHSIPQRPYEGFFFHKLLPVSQLQEQGLEVALPQGMHIQLAACESDEYAVEVNGEGIFTKNMLAVLKASHGQISYRDLESRVQKYMRFGYEQHPRVYVPGEQATRQLSRGFLNQPIDERALSASVLYNQQKGWLLDVGAIHGVGQPDQTIHLFDHMARVVYTVRVKHIGADYTVLTIADDSLGTLDRTSTYRATVTGLLLKPIRLHLLNHGGPTTELPDLLTRLTTRPSVNQADTQRSETFFIPENNESQADYTLHVRNGLYYVTHPTDENRPLVRPVQTDDPQALDTVTQTLRHISQWQYLRELRNGDAQSPVLTVDVCPEGSAPMTLKEAHSLPVPISFLENKGQWQTTLSIRLTNPTNQPLYCTVLYLSRDFMSFMGFLPVNYRLEPSQSVMLGLADARAPTGRQASFRLKLEEVIRQYNWPIATEQFKLLITTSPLADMTLAFLNLKALPSPPILSDLLKPMADRGALDIDTNEADSLPEWSTQTITLKLVNPLYNKVQLNELRQMLEPTTLIDNIMADFALGLYLESDKVDSMHPELTLRKSLHVIDHDEGQRGLWNDFTVSVANKAAQWSQNRRNRI